MFFKLIVRQLWHKRVVAFLVLLAMTALVTLYVYSSNTSKFANRSMQLVMKNMGHNLLILPKDADLQAVYLCSEGQTTFPEATAREVSKHGELLSKYYVSVLQSRTTIQGQQFILTGIEPVTRKDESREKGNMVRPLTDTEARLGAEAARRLAKATGDSLEIDDRMFEIVEVLPPKATLDDCRVYVNLAQCQKILGKPDQIHFILAFLCLEAGSLERSLEVQERMLADACPKVRQISRMDVAQGRYLARLTTQKSLHYLLAIVAAATIIVVAVTGLQEVNDRRYETGIMIAMGVSQAYIVCLYLIKTLLLAVGASIIGFLLGSLLAVRLTETFLVVNTAPVAIVWTQLPPVIGLTCLVAAIAETLPVLKLLSLDPSTVLSEQ
jgi:putative ABC transport system permease protein